MNIRITTLVMALAAVGFAHAAAAAEPSAGGQEHAAAASGQMALDDYAGTYPLAPGFELVIRQRDGNLYGQATGQPEFPLQHVEDDGFSNPGFGIEIEFERGADGSVSGLQLRQGGQVLDGRRQ